MAVQTTSDGERVLRPGDRYSRLIARSKAMRALIEALKRLEGHLTTVLVEGESGSGKELVAEALHAHSTVRQGPFVAVNCGAMDRALARSELFGHRKGAFTGALEGHVGAFEAASGGTLFLDEIGELSAEVQPTLLRALETSTIYRVGEAIPRRVSVRIVAATNRNLAREVREGRFREDLFYRLSVVKLQVPPLRERQEDFARLAADLAANAGLHELPESVLHELSSRSFRGNVRELKNAILAYAVMGVLPPEEPQPVGPDPAPNLQTAIDPTRPYAAEKHRLVRHFQSIYFRGVLDIAKGNRSEAARLARVERSYLGKILRDLRMIR